MYTHTSTFYTEIRETKWFNNGVEFIPTAEEKLMHSIFGVFDKVETVKEVDLFTVQYQKVNELNTLWLNKSEELGYNPSDVLLRKTK